MFIANKKSDHVIGLIGLFVLYVVVHGWLLLNKSYFWDDWIWVTHPEELRSAMNEMGIIFFKPVLYFLYSSPQAVLLIKLLIFSSFLAGSCLFYLTLSMLSGGKNKNFLIVGVLFAILPYDIIGRSLLCTFIYSLSFFMFCLGYYGYVRYRVTRQWLFLILTPVVVTLSFNTASFLVLYPVLFALTELILLPSEKLQWRRAVLAFFLCLLHAGVFFIFKKHYFPTQEYYSSYNQISLSGKTFFDLFFNRGPVSFLRPLIFSFLGQSIALTLTKAAGFLLVILFYWPLIAAGRRKDHVAFKCAFVGVALILAAVFPYLAAGKSPNSFSWDSRNELLLPFGAVFWLLGFVRLYANKKYVPVTWAVLFFFFSFGSIRFYLSVQGLHFQQKALIEGVQANVDMQNSGAYILVSNVMSPGVVRVNWSFYNLSGILNLKSDMQKHAIIEIREIENFNDANKRAMFFSKRYMLASAQWAPPFYCLTMSGKERISEWDALRLLAKEVFISEAEAMKEVSSYYTFTKVPAQVVDLKPDCSG